VIVPWTSSASSVAQSNKNYDQRIEELNKQIAKTNEKLKS
jgi:hypothetical protein